MNLSLLKADEKAGKIGILRNSDIVAVEEKHGKPLVKFQKHPEKVFDYVVYGIGGNSPAAFLQNADIELDDRGNARLDDWLETNVTGLYVAGEISIPPGTGSIIASFNSGKRTVEGIMRAMGILRQPELVHM